VFEEVLRRNEATFKETGRSSVAVVADRFTSQILFWDSLLDCLQGDLKGNLNLVNGCIGDN
jgi:hypothetical protein